MQIFSRVTNAEKTLFSLLSAARPVPVTKWMGMGSSFASLSLRLPSVSLRAQARDLRPGEAHDIASLEEACRWSGESDKFSFVGRILLPALGLFSPGLNPARDYFRTIAGLNYAIRPTNYCKDPLQSPVRCAAEASFPPGKPLLLQGFGTPSPKIAKNW